jgi:hypothetical protein
MEHSNMDGGSSYPQTDIIAPSEALKLFRKKWYTQELISYINVMPFRITRFAFESDLGFFCQNTNRYACAGFSFNIPIQETKLFFDALRTTDADISRLLTQSNQYRSSFLIFEKERPKIIIPEIYDIDLFVEDELIRLSELFF